MTQAAAEAERRCNGCGRIKPIEQFEKAKRYRGGRMPRCRTCRAEYKEALYRRPRVEIGDTKQCTGCGATQDLSEFCRDHRSRDGYGTRCRSCRRARRKQEPGDARARDRMFRWKYGITEAEYDEMVAAQEGKCAACGNEPAPAKHLRNNLFIDHCHQNGQVRGLLCHGCNAALGLLQENLKRIEGLARYIRLAAEPP